MAIRFHDVTHGPLRAFSGDAPAGSIVGILGEDLAAQQTLLRLAAGQETASAGIVSVTGSARLLGIADPPNLGPVENLLVFHAFAMQGSLVKSRAALGLETLRRNMCTILLASNDHELLLSLADEIWWIEQGAMVQQGNPKEVLEAYQREVARQFRSWGEAAPQVLTPSMRRGDGRARLVSVETRNAQGGVTMVWQSGETVSVRVLVRYEAPVDDPVVGMLIRTRIGFEVYGTNTELEKIKLGPVQTGEMLAVTFEFPCNLCPQEYTVTAAAHDPDGVWHDWLEDAVAVAVADTRYTAGVANLRATVRVERAAMPSLPL